MATAPSPPQPPAVPVDCGLLANRTNLLSLRPEVVWCYNLDQPEYIALYGDCESYYSTSLTYPGVRRLCTWVDGRCVAGNPRKTLALSCEGPPPAVPRPSPPPPTLPPYPPGAAPAPRPPSTPSPSPPPPPFQPPPTVPLPYCPELDGRTNLLATNNFCYQVGNPRFDLAGTCTEEEKRPR